MEAPTEQMPTGLFIKEDEDEESYYILRGYKV